MSYSPLPHDEVFSPFHGLMFSMGADDMDEDDQMQVRVPRAAQHLWAPKTKQPPAGSGGGEGDIAVPQGFAMTSFDALANEESIFVSRIFDIKEACWERNNKYKICKVTAEGKPDYNAQFMYVGEKSTCAGRIFCGNYRETTLNIHNGLTKDDPIILSLLKPMNILNSCIPCIARPEMKMTQTADSLEIGKVVDPFACCNVTQSIFNASGEVIAKIYGPCCQFGMVCPCVNVTFIIQSPDGQPIGKIEKVFNGMADLCLNCNNFRIDFPTGSNAYFKALLIGAAFLIDFQYFEPKKDGGN